MFPDINRLGYSVAVRKTPLILVCLMMWPAAGCSRRTIRIESEPSGALVWLNHREIGRTPVEVEFTHYGTYDLMLRKDGWEPMIGPMPTGLSLHGTPGIDLMLEVLPIRTHDLIVWRIPLVPRDEDHEALLQRANALRDEAGAFPEGASTP